MNTAQTPMYEWKDLPWRKIERAVFKLQKRIYQVSYRTVLMTRAYLLRSRMRPKLHVRF